MFGNFAACDAFTAQAEGGLSMDPQDPGNWTGGAIGAGVLKGTKYGIAASAHPTVDIANLTPAGAAAIRQAGYWTPINGDALPLGVDLEAYDFAINAGPRTSIRELEAALGTPSDGAIGPDDIAALAAADPVALIGKLKAAHEAHYAALPGFTRYGGGWDSRAERCATASLAMVAAAQPPPQAVIPPVVAQPAPAAPPARTIGSLLTSRLR